MRKTLIDYRLCNNKLPIETGRWANVDRNLRKCKLCNYGTIGDEFHYLMACCFFDFDRKIFLPHINKKTVYGITYSNLLNDTNTRRLRRLCNFLKIVIDNLGHILVLNACLDPPIHCSCIQQCCKYHTLRVKGICIGFLSTQ